jgi:hypothetical protein
MKSVRITGIALVLTITSFYVGTCVQSASEEQLTAREMQSLREIGIDPGTDLIKMGTHTAVYEFDFTLTAAYKISQGGEAGLLRQLKRSRSGVAERSWTEIQNGYWQSPWIKSRKAGEYLRGEYSSLSKTLIVTTEHI